MRSARRSGHNSVSVHKIWLALLIFVLMVAMMELSYTWIFMPPLSTRLSSPALGWLAHGGGEREREPGGGGDKPALQWLDGYSYGTGFVDGLRRDEAAGSESSQPEGKQNDVWQATVRFSARASPFSKLRVTSRHSGAMFHNSTHNEEERPQLTHFSYETFFERYPLNKIPTSPQWVVLDATSGDCTQHLTSAPPAGWKVMAVVLKPAAECQPPHCYALTVEQGLQAESEEGRTFVKNVAYLVVIARGARLVLLSDCTANLNRTVKVLAFAPEGEREHGLLYNETALFNPYSHFGAWATVPRAWPDAGHRGSHSNGTRDNSRLYFLRDIDSVRVKHGLSATSPDSRSAGGSRNWDRGRRFDYFTPPVFVGHTSATPAVPVASMYRLEAFWGLLLVHSPSALVSLVLRQLTQQRLLRELDGFSGFYQLDTTSDDSYDVETEISDRLWDIETIAADISAWKCRDDAKFLDCLVNLLDHLKIKGHLDQEQLESSREWLSFYQKLGGKEPARVDHPWRGVRKTSEVRVALGSLKSQLEAGGHDEEQRIVSLYRNSMQRSCRGSKTDTWYPIRQWHNPVMKEVALVIVFNYNRFIVKNLPILETVYRPFFKYIILCTPNMDELLEGVEGKVLRHVILVEGHSDQWYLMYECLSMAAQMNLPGVKGYMQVGDDTLVNLWRLYNTSRDRLILPKSFTSMRADSDRHAWKWYWWTKSRGRLATVKTMADIEQIAGLSAQQWIAMDPNFNKTKTGKSPNGKTAKTFSQIYSEAALSIPRPPLPGSADWAKPTKAEAIKFLTNYYKLNQLAGRVKHRAVDLFYVPQSLARDYITWSRFFQSHGVLIELAVPTIHYGLASSHTDVTYVKASSVWDDNRKISYTFYDDSMFFLHPFKMVSDLINSENARTFFCDNYVNNLFLNLSKIVK